MHNNTDSNKCESIVRDISDINFPRLVWLHLYDNEIESIDILCRIQLPVLKEIDMGNH